LIYIFDLNATYDGSGKWQLDPLWFHVVSNSSTVYDDMYSSHNGSYAMYLYAPMGSAELSKGQSVSGQVSFELPRGQGPVQLVYDGPQGQPQQGDVRVTVGSIPPAAGWVSRIDGAYVYTQGLIPGFGYGLDSVSGQVLYPSTSRYESKVFYTGDRIDVQISLGSISRGGASNNAFSTRCGLFECGFTAYPTSVSVVAINELDSGIQVVGIQPALPFLFNVSSPQPLVPAAIQPSTSDFNITVVAPAYGYSGPLHLQVTFSVITHVMIYPFEGASTYSGWTVNLVQTSINATAVAGMENLRPPVGCTFMPTDTCPDIPVPGSGLAGQQSFLPEPVWWNESMPPVEFVYGPQVSPMGPGSAALYAGTSGTQVLLLYRWFNESAALSSLTSLTYYTFVYPVQGTCKDVNLELILSNGNSLVFEPCYQTGGYPTAQGAGTVPDQCPAPGCVMPASWQKWDAFAGGWMVENQTQQSLQLTTVGLYATMHPGVNVTGVALTVGGGTPWNGFIGYANDLSAGVGADTITFGFQPCTSAYLCPVGEGY
jgi:hypothetical protein